MKYFKITVLVENSANREDLLTEHGLAFLIEQNGVFGLFDTGQSNIFLKNAQIMGLDLTPLHWVVLSHGHYDHAGGISSIADFSGWVRIFAHPEAFSPRFIKEPDGNFLPIGIPISKDGIKKIGLELLCSSEPVEVAGQIMTTGEIPRVTDFEPEEEVFFTKKGSDFVPDLFPDDIGLIIKTSKGVVVLLGCAHAGVINTLLRVINIIGEEKIYAVIGGMHLAGASDKRIQRTIDAFHDFGISRIGLAHCTGRRAAKAFLAAFGNSCFMCPTGTVLEF
ncbi:MAG: MBL fold metallo-hydrolase [bacterium]